VTIRKDAITRPDRRIAASHRTMAFLLDVSVDTLDALVSKGVVPRPREIHGLLRYDVAATYEALFGDGRPQVDEVAGSGQDEDPFDAATRAKYGTPASGKNRPPRARAPG
jgi:hypothetical protein